MEKVTDRSKFYGIGASDVPTILGLNPFATPLQLFSRLTGITEPSPTTEPQYWGKKKEQIIAERFAEDHGVKLIAWKERYVHPDMEFFSCELDRKIVGERRGVECKSVNEYKAKSWDGDTSEMPDYVIAQVNAQMGLAKMSEMWVAVLIGASDYREKLVKFDQELYALTEQRVAEFWKMVEEKTPPMAMVGDDEILLSLHPKDNENIEQMDHLETAVARRQELSEQIKQMTEEKDEIEIKIKDCIGDNLGLKTERYLVKWTPTKASRVDVDMMKREGVYEKFLYTTSTRRLTIKLNKPEGKKEVEK